ncbi:SPOR domain-containing protein [Pandoraea sp. CB10b_02]|uniref:SPOR domain-containing protein n=1 Tax=Pandoraea sp. CB10b_02 TaxID=2014535 RepID=UPI0025800FC7|nr:SPOR domain-containing protein [Pandoraea sp. CB10b_02]
MAAKPGETPEMLRALLLLMFIAANAALAAVQFGWLKWRDVLPATGREPARLATQLEPGRIRLTGAELSAPELASGAATTPDAAGGASRGAVEPNNAPPSPASAAAAAASQAVAAATPSSSSGEAAANPSASQPAAATAAATAAAIATATAASTCLDVGPFASNDAAQARGLLLAALPAGQGDIQSVALDKRYWVHLDPVPSKAAADKQVAQLRAAGVTEYFLLNGDGPSLVVSLGLFSDRERAARLMSTAQKKGLTPQLSERPNARSRIIYRIAGINANAATQVRGVVSQQWSASLVRTCPAPAGSPPAGAH